MKRVLFREIRQNRHSRESGNLGRASMPRQLYPQAQMQEKHRSDPTYCFSTQAEWLPVFMKYPGQKSKLVFQLPAEQFRHRIAR